MPKNPLSNMSYTNKDFNSIYVELLDLVKQLSSKWDPSMSNESDPGNILIKLDAIIGDKNNYNIDKNVLELFPETLSQEISARSLYKQLAYNMPWYRGATTTISMKWGGNDEYKLDTDIISAIIPRFQMVSDESTEFVYTLLDDVIFTKFSTEANVRAIEGVITDLSINGSTLIELSNLDSNNRIYLEESNVAENGIFIINANGSKYDYWNQVENIYSVSPNSKVYEFGVDPRTNLCYLEFPQDIANLIDEGLNIKYIVTNGSQGNISPRTITKFYQTPTFTFGGTENTMPVELVLINNFSASNNGSDPESIEDAYKNYMKTAGTFHTLVTLRDYINAICNSGLVSNTVVSDRTNDVQSSYTVIVDEMYSKYPVKECSGEDYFSMYKVETMADLDKYGPSESYWSYIYQLGGYIYTPTTYDAVKSTIESMGEVSNVYVRLPETNHELTAFDLRIYALQPIGANTSKQYTLEDYNKSFRLIPSADLEDVKAYIEDEKSIQHDYKDIIPNRPCIFRNEYPIQMRIIPQYKLEATEIESVKLNISKALLNLLNSNNISFGEMPDYDMIYNTIINSDERIRTLILEDFKYQTKVIWWDDDKHAFYSGYINETIPSKMATRYPENGNEPSEEDMSENVATLLKGIQEDIIVKSILAGVTPLCEKNSSISFSPTQTGIFYKSAKRIDTNLTLTPSIGLGTDVYKTIEQWRAEHKSDAAKWYVDKLLVGGINITPIPWSLPKLTSESAGVILSSLGGAAGFSLDTILCTIKQEATPYTPVFDTINNTYTIRPNESIRALSPALETTKTYSISIKYVGNIPRSISANTSTVLGEGEWISFIWRDSSDEHAPYKYEKYTSGSIIKPNFNLMQVITNIPKTGDDTSNDVLLPITYFPNSSGEIPYGSPAYDIIYNNYTFQVLSGTNSVEILTPTEAGLPANTKKYYFFTRDIIEENDGKKYQMVFNKVREDKYAYTLGEDEQFYYLSKDATSIEGLGTGSYIELTIPNNANNTVTLKVSYVSPQDLSDSGISAFLDKCEVLSYDTIVKQQTVYNFIEGNQLRIKFNTTRGIGSDNKLDNVYLTKESDKYYLRYADGVTPSSPIEVNPLIEIKSDSYTHIDNNLYTLSYSTDSGKSFTDLPGLIFNDGSGISWEIGAFYNLNCGPDNPQVINNDINNVENFNATTTLNIPSSDSEYITPSGEDNTLTYLMSSYPVLKQGGKNIDVGILTNDGVQDNTFYVYSTSTEMVDGVTYNSDGSVTINVNELKSLPLISLTLGDINTYDNQLKYILPIKISTKGDTPNFKVDVSLVDAGNTDTPLTTINGEDGEYGSINLNGVYYYEISNGGKLKLAIVKPSNNDYEIQIEIGNLYCYKLNSIIGDAKYGFGSDDILSKINLLSKGKFKFIMDYDEDLVIKNPLDASSFFEANHIYNKYTIAKALLKIGKDEDDNSSYIKVINNR